MDDISASRQFVDAAVQTGLKPNDVRTILWAIVAPATLDDLSEVLGKFRRVLLAAEKEWQGTLVAAGIATWPDQLTRLQLIAQRLGFPTTPADKRHLGQRGEGGHRQRNALYSALLALSDDGTAYSAQCDVLMAHVFLAHLHLLRLPAGTKLHGGLVKGDTSMEAYESHFEKEPWPALTIQPKNCCLALRAYFSGEEWARAVVAAFPANLPPADFAVYAGLAFDVAFLQYGKSQKWLDYLQDYLLHYLAQAYGLKPRHRGHGKKPLPPGAETIDVYRHDICPGEDDEDEVDGHSGYVGSGAAARSSKSDKPRRPVSAGRNGKRGLRRRAGSAAGSGSSQAIRTSKFFPFLPTRLSPSDLVAIDIDGRERAGKILALLRQADWSASGARAIADGSAEQAQFAEAELLLFALVMLWTGSDVERTIALRLYLAQNCFDHIPFLIMMSADSEGADARIRIQVTFPPDAPRREMLAPYDRNRKYYVELPDAAELGPMLWNFLAVLDGASVLCERSTGIEVFRQPPGYYREHIPRLLARVSGGDRLTHSALASTLYDEIMNWTPKDSSAATIITGDFRNRARVQMFYADRYMDRLQEIDAGTIRYLRAAIALARGTAADDGPASTGLVDLIRLEHHARVRTPFVPAHDSMPCVGINACPNDNAMRRAVQALIERIESLWANTSLRNWPEVHNLYTFYTLWFFGFVTGVRPIICPYLALSEIDEDTMSARLRDKGRSKERLVWVTGDLLAQMKLHQSYMATTRLVVLDKYPCWFLDPQGAPEVVSNRTREAILHEFLPGFPTNIHRRWMFNALLDSGCPFVAEWAGHFLVGNRLVGRGATASPSEIGRQLLTYVEPIIDFLGFGPMPFRGHGS